MNANLMSCRARVLSLLASLSIFFAVAFPTEAAGGVKKDAVKQLNSAFKGRMTGLKGEFKARENVLLANIGVVKAKLKAGNGSTGDVVTVFNDLTDFQSDVQALIYNLSIPMAQDVSAIMKIMDDAGIGYSDYPDEFCFGLPGPVSGFRDDVRKFLSKRYAKLRKQLRKLATKFSEQANTNVVFRLHQPAEVREAVLSLGGFGTTSAAVTLTIDLIVGFSSASLFDDGQLRASGAAFNSATPISVTHSALGSGTTSSVAVTGSRRWTYAASGLSEQNYTLRAITSDSLHASHHSVAVR